MIDAESIDRCFGGFRACVIKLDPKWGCGGGGGGGTFHCYVSLLAVLQSVQVHWDASKLSTWLFPGGGPAVSRAVLLNGLANSSFRLLEITERTVGIKPLF